MSYELKTNFILSPSFIRRGAGGGLKCDNNVTTDIKLRIK